ncbi:hypothetical protein J5X84_27795 [Streptosporangiaceae bacterium NEAU-GS5]|nr:hypothetical protein [Streptosporangiaceae bacterium NEAU-GS5]
MDPFHVGHKFARLEELRKAGFPVPPLFCVPVAEFDRALEALPRLDGDREAWCAAAARALAGATPGEALSRSLLSGFDALVGEDGLVAVRACVVPGQDGAGEDTAADPFAGMSESFLYVRRDDLLPAVARCWGSAFKPEAVRYRMLKGMDPARARVAVGIQRMALGTRSFVAFTRDPRDFARRCVIAAAYGIGEGVVQERADIDHFFVDQDTRQVESEIVTKRRMVGAESLCAVPAGLAEPPVLTVEQARAVAELAWRVEEFYGAPQDIEGTITPDGALHLVQARPMVVPEEVHWGNHNITESYPGISSALTYSQARVFYQAGFTDLYRRMGVPRRLLRANTHRLARMVGHLNGRVYYRLDDWQVLHGQLPVFDLVRRDWEEAMGISGTARAGRRWSGARIARNLPSIAWRALTHQWANRRFFRWWDGLMAEVDAVERRSAEELVALYRRLWDEAGRRWGVTLVNGLYGLIVLRTGKALLRRWTGAGPELFVGLLYGGRENRSLAAARAAIALAERAGAVPELREALLGPESAQDDRRVWNAIASGEHGPELAESARAYLRRYGDRALHDLKLDEPTPRQRPWMMVGVLRPFVRQGTTVAGNRAAEQAMATEARRQLRAACPNPIRRMVLRGLLAYMRSFIRTREDARFCRTQLFGVTRDVLWRLGGLLAAAGLLDDAQDVVDLTVEEVIGAFDGTLPGSDPAALAALRKAERLGYEKLPPPPVQLSTRGTQPLAAALRNAVPLGEHAPGGSPGELHGLGSSGGRVRAQAKIVLDPSIDPDSCRDRILIARETDPGWLTLMIAAAGLVVERGTLLSHTAITGRLLGVPTVVALTGATTHIPDGAWIELDGGAGTVRVLETHGR